MPYLVSGLNKKFGPIKVLKKNNLYFCISTKQFVFKDALLFTSPCSLSEYLAQNGIQEKKSIFPYQLFHSIEDMRACETFPPREAFYSVLKNSNVDENEYKEARNKFNRRKRLPEGHPDAMRSMVDWLAYYNELDTAPLAKAIDNSFGFFFEIFGIDPSFCVSLPKFAQSCMFRSYDVKSPLCYSFWKKQSAVRQLFRNNLTGGLVNVFHRCIDLSGRSNMPKASQYATNGDPYTSLMFFDFNSLYLHAQLQPFPATPGYEFSKLF